MSRMEEMAILDLIQNIPVKIVEGFTKSNKQEKSTGLFWERKATVQLFCEDFLKLMGGNECMGKREEEEKEKEKEKTNIQKDELETQLYPIPNEVDFILKHLKDQKFCIMNLPKKLHKDILKMVEKKTPTYGMFEPIFTCRKGSKFSKKCNTKAWILSEDGKSYSDGRRIQCKLFKAEKEKTSIYFEKWLNLILKKETPFVTSNYLMLKMKVGCHRQEMHADFNVEEKDDYNLMFGIVGLKKTSKLWVRQEHLKRNRDKELVIKSGQLFIARGSLIHGGAESLSPRLHFLFVNEKMKEQFKKYDQTVFMDD